MLRYFSNLYPGKQELKREEILSENGVKTWEKNKWRLFFISIDKAEKFDLKEIQPEDLSKIFPQQSHLHVKN